VRVVPVPQIENSEHETNECECNIEWSVFEIPRFISRI